MLIDQICTRPRLVGGQLKSLRTNQVRYSFVYLFICLSILFIYFRFCFPIRSVLVFVWLEVGSKLSVSTGQAQGVCCLNLLLLDPMYECFRSARG